MKYNGFVIDIETNGFFFQANQIWTMHLRDLDGGDNIFIHPFTDPLSKDKLVSYIKKYNNPRVVFHNGLGFDMFMLLKIMGVEFSVGPDTICGIKCRYIDTFYMSMYLNPDRLAHSIEHFGGVLGFPKMNFRQELIDGGFLNKSSPKGEEFMSWNPIMDRYVEQDTLVGMKTFFYLLREWTDRYSFDEEMPQHYKCGQKAFYLMSCQSLTGWKFDVEKAQALRLRIQVMMEDIRAAVEPQLPPRKLKKSEESLYSFPAKPWKNDGTFSSHMENFIKKHNLNVIDDNTVLFNGDPVAIVSKGMLPVTLPMEMGNQEDMKGWFLSNGWIPEFYNFQKDSNGKPVRDSRGKLIKTSPKIQEQGKICPNLEKMEGEIVKDVVKWLSLRNRLAVLEGWLGNERLAVDGRIGADRTGIASTHRQKHKVLVNVPKASEKVLLGKEFRELFTSEDGFTIAAGDASALEGRVQGHYTWKYDKGLTAKELLEGDVHAKTAKSVYAEELKDFDITASDFNKDDPKFKPFRDRAKNVFYAALYGAGDSKIASTAGLPEHMGTIISERFWEANEGTKKLKDALESYWTSRGNKKYLPAIDGRILCTRKKSALLNTVFQSCGGIVMDYAGCYLDAWLGGIKWDTNVKPHYIYKGYVVRRIGYFHDEYEFECEEPIAEEVAKMIEYAIQKAGERLRLNVPLKGEGKVGKSWKDVH